MAREIAGRGVIVTGGARGIGRAVVERLADRGARVAVGDVDMDLAAEVVAPYDDHAAAAPLDVTDPASWQEFLAAVDHLGPWDVLVNNAGIMPLGSVLKEPDRVTRAIVDVNLHGPINGTKAVASGMVERGSGHIVNVASAVGRIAVPDGATYSASKHGVVGFSEATRQELAPFGVDVTVVLPTVVQTELAAGVPATRGIGPVTPEQVAEVIEAAIRRPRAELWVPRWSQGLSKTTLALPRFVQRAMARATHADTVLSSADARARAAYEDRARRSARD